VSSCGSILRCTQFTKLLGCLSLVQYFRQAYSILLHRLCRPLFVWPATGTAWRNWAIMICIYIVKLVKTDSYQRLINNMSSYRWKNQIRYFFLKFRLTWINLESIQNTIKADIAKAPTFLFHLFSLSLHPCNPLWQTASPSLK